MVDEFRMMSRVEHFFRVRKSQILTAAHLTSPNLQLVYFYMMAPAGNPPSPCLRGIIKAADLSAYTF